MKRNKNLETLSWEHHEGLVLAFRLEKGLKTKVDIKMVTEYLLFIWDHVLKHHFWLEEQILPQPLQGSEKGKKLICQMINEHKQFNNLIKIIRQNKNDNRATIEGFYRKLKDHIRFEERILFPLVEDILSEPELAKMSNFLHEHHKLGCVTWKHEFWHA